MNSIVRLYFPIVSGSYCIRLCYWLWFRHGSDIVTGSVSGGTVPIAAMVHSFLCRRSGAEPQKPKSRDNGNGKTARTQSKAKTIRPAAKAKRKAKSAKSQNREAQNSKKKSRLYCIDSFCSTTYFSVFRQILFSGIRSFTLNPGKYCFFDITVYRFTGFFSGCFNHIIR